MSRSIQREIPIPRPPEQVWRAIANRESLADWMYPNDFEPRVGHRFTFRVPPNPQARFDGLIVECEVLECVPPSRLVFSWSAGGPVTDTRVSFRLEPDGNGTRIHFEHSGFDETHPWGARAIQGAGYGWAAMFERLTDLLERLANLPPSQPPHQDTHE